MATPSIDDKLNNLLKRSQNPSEHNLLPDELVALTHAFLPTNPEIANVRPKAYVVLSAICQGARKAAIDSETATKTLTKIFGPLVVQLFGETDEGSLLTAICFLIALFQVDALSASAIFVRDGLVENLMDSVDLAPSLLLAQEVAHVLGQAAGHKSCRAIITPQIIRWLEFKSSQSTDVPLQSAASVALIKLSKGSIADAAEDGSPQVNRNQMDVMVKTMIDIVVSGQNSSSVDTVEGLAYLSTDPAVKEQLATNAAFLKNLFSLVPIQKSVPKSSVNPTLVYGVVAIIANLATFRPRLSEEQKQVEKLKRMTKTGKESLDTAVEAAFLDDDDHVKTRIRRLLSEGVLTVFPAAVVLSDSAAVRLTIGRAILGIVEEKENRGKVLQAGGGKVLQVIIKQGLSSAEKDTKKQVDVDPAYLEPIQALAKLAITSSPVQVFGPNIGAIYDAIRPFSILLQHSASNLLQRFEAIMALTNLASHNPEVASRIAKADGILNRVELLLLEDHALIRRASVELVCNLIAGSDDTFQRYSGETSSSASKIHVLLALSDVEDLPTRVASSGALATLTTTSSACKALIDLQLERRRFLPIMTALIAPSALVDPESKNEVLETSPALVHRGVFCVANVFKSIQAPDTRERISKEAKECGLVQALVQVAKGQGAISDAGITHQAAEALKTLVG